MKLIVFGAAGGLGTKLVEQALTKNHEVTAFVRDADDIQPSGVRVVVGDVNDAATVAEAVAGQDAVIDAIGGQTPWKSTGLEQEAAKNIVVGMQRAGVRRLVVTSAMGVGDSADVADFAFRSLLAPTFLRGTIKDKGEMEDEVESASLDWVIVRPAVLTDGELTGNVKMFEPGAEEKAHKIARADVAAFMLEQLTSDAYLHQTVTIATE